MRRVCSVLSAIEESSELWFPALAKDLVRQACRQLLVPVGLDSRNYGTSRYIQRTAKAPREELARVAVGPEHTFILEYLYPDEFCSYAGLGLRQIPATRSFVWEGAAATLSEAMSFLETCPSLRETLASLVRCVHLIESDGEEFDISHSDPKVPFSVFLSIPTGACNASLRVCESLLHEAMHLLLSLIERRTPLVTHHSARLRSPWRDDLRPPAGLLHGIYVFSVLQELYRRSIAEEAVTGGDRTYLMRRRAQIQAELREAFSSCRASAFTQVGNELLQLLASRLAETRLLNAPHSRPRSPSNDRGR